MEVPDAGARATEAVLEPLRRSLGSGSDARDEACLTALQLTLQGGGPAPGLAWLLVLLDDVGRLLQGRGGSEHEEMRLRAVRVALLALRSLGPSARQASFWQGLARRGLLGFVLAQLLECARGAKMRALRLEALQAACHLFRAMLEGDARVAAAFLPGYASVLQHVACGDFKQGCELTELALGELGHACVRLLPRAEHGDALHQLHELALASSSSAAAAAAAAVVTAAVRVEEEQQEGQRPTFFVERDSEWVRASCGKMVPLLLKVVRYVHHTFGEMHDEPTIRVQLARLCGALLRDSCVSSPTALTTPQLVDVLVLYSSDAWDSVASAARHEVALLSAAARLEEAHACVKDSFMALIVALPRIVRRAMDTEKVTKLRMLSSYIGFLGTDHVAALMASSQRSVGEALLQVLALDHAMPDEGPVESRITFGLHLSLAEHGVGGVGGALSSTAAPFAHCRAGVAAAAALAIPLELGRVACLDLLDFVVERIASAEHDVHAECFLFCRQFLAGYAQRSNAASAQRLAARLAEVALQPLPCTVDAVGAAQCCDLLRAVAMLCKQAFGPLVPRSVPLLLTLLGSPSARQSQAAWSCLEAVAASVAALGSVHELIRANADYVVDAVVRDLRASRSTWQGATTQEPVPLSVSGLLKHSPTNASWLLDDVLHEVLACLDASSKTPADLLLYSRILRDLAAAVPEPGAAAAAAPDSDGEPDDTDKAEPRCSREEAIALRILDRVRHMVPCPALAVQTHALAAVCRCLTLLRTNRKELLPAIYSVWDPLMLRLEAQGWAASSDADDALLVAMRVADALAIMAELGTDFLAGEKFERIWRSFRPMLVRQQHASLAHMQPSDGGGGGGHQSLLDRLRDAILRSLMQLVSHVPVSNASARSVVDTLLPLHDDARRLASGCLCALASQSNAHRVYLWFAARRAARQDLVDWALSRPELLLGAVAAEIVIQRCPTESD